MGVNRDLCILKIRSIFTEREREREREREISRERERVLTTSTLSRANVVMVVCAIRRAEAQVRIQIQPDAVARVHVVWFIGVPVSPREGSSIHPYMLFSGCVIFQSYIYRCGGHYPYIKRQIKKLAKECLSGIAKNIFQTKNQINNLI